VVEEGIQNIPEFPGFLMNLLQMLPEPERVYIAPAAVADEGFLLGVVKHEPVIKFTFLIGRLA
jgi:hypothetical protein